MAQKKPNLIITAHPDDETLFFSGLIQQLRDRPWHVICVTNGLTDDRAKARTAELFAACDRLKVASVKQLDFEDQFDKRLEIKKLTRILQKQPLLFNQVFTHGPLGEYGHPHHQDICLAVCQAFYGKLPIHGVAYNQFPKLTIQLSRKQWQKKIEILTEIYKIEMSRFIHLLPCTTQENFHPLDLKTVSALYRVLSQKSSVKSLEKLADWRWFKSFFEGSGYDRLKRPF